SSSTWLLYANADVLHVVPSDVAVHSPCRAGSSEEAAVRTGGSVTRTASGIGRLHRPWYTASPSGVQPPDNLVARTPRAPSDSSLVRAAEARRGGLPRGRSAVGVVGRVVHGLAASHAAVDEAEPRHGLGLVDVAAVDEQGEGH